MSTHSVQFKILGEVSSPTSVRILSSAKGQIVFRAITVPQFKSVCFNKLKNGVMDCLDRQTRPEIYFLGLLEEGHSINLIKYIKNQIPCHQNTVCHPNNSHFATVLKFFPFLFIHLFYIFQSFIFTYFKGIILFSYPIYSAADQFYKLSVANVVKYIFCKECS